MTEPLRLYVLRHAKSATKTDGSDFDRPLAKRGIQEAHEVAEAIVAAGIEPVLILCSAARRARETLLPILARLDSEGQVMITRMVYEADGPTLLALIRLSGDAPSVMVVGHNPVLEELTQRLAGDGDAAAMAALEAGFPPAGLATLSFEADDWGKIDEGRGRLLDFRVPAPA